MNVYMARIAVVSMMLGLSGTGMSMAADCVKGNCSDGVGIMIEADGTEYQGTFKNGFPNGKGVFTYPEGKRITTGSVRYKDGLRFENKFPMGKLYEGDVVDGERHGKGRLEYYSGAVYTGEFKNGLLDGRGVMVNPNGVTVEGEFSKGQPNGTGTVSFPDGRRYEGEIEENKLHGKGRMIYPDGRVEAGLFKKGKYVGPASD
ncbi:MAG: hypothetical protein CSA22_04015 [Deltaproteobacteria bacterium]|nr:MAG: hypothetical protein CSA22_04015 [Deltaproteobacteria bacterium]